MDDNCACGVCSDLRDNGWLDPSDAAALRKKTNTKLPARDVAWANRLDRLDTQDIRRIIQTQRNGCNYCKGDAVFCRKAPGLGSDGRCTPGTVERLLDKIGWRA